MASGAGKVRYPEASNTETSDGNRIQWRWGMLPTSQIGALNLLNAPSHGFFQPHHPFHGTSGMIARLSRPRLDPARRKSRPCGQLYERCKIGLRFSITKLRTGNPIQLAVVEIAGAERLLDERFLRQAGQAGKA